MYIVYATGHTDLLFGCCNIQSDKNDTVRTEWKIQISSHVGQILQRTFVNNIDVVSLYWTIVLFTEVYDWANAHRRNLYMC